MQLANWIFPSIIPASERVAAALSLSLLFSATLAADDWPQWRGLNRDGVWNESGVPEKFPPGGLEIRWRAPVGAGLSSPIVARGRVYVTDSELRKPKAWERVHCFDEKTGQALWTFSNEVNYPDWAFDGPTPAGPCSTPLVENGRLFALGATGDLLCLDAVKGKLIWKKKCRRVYGLEDFPNLTPSPLMESGLLIVVIGGKPGACVVAFNPRNGKEAWRALDDSRTYSSPSVASAGGKRQLIIWTLEGVTSLNPTTGRIWWRETLNTPRDIVIATPIVSGDLMLLGGLMFRLDAQKPAASVLWPATQALSARILSQLSLPVIKDGYVFSDKLYGRLVCLDANNGKQIWETDKITETKSGAALHLTPNGDSFLLFTDQGNLIRARLDPSGYQEICRTHLVDPTYPFNGRNVVWPPPAYANQHVFARNEKEIVCASLAPRP